jgi:hypothetical protein
VESQKTIIKEAFRHCGNDSTIAAWNNYLFPTRVPLPNTIELERFEQSQENITIRIKHDDHSWSNRTLSPDEINLVKKAYTMRNDSVFVLKNVQLDKDSEKKLVEILGGCTLYLNKFCRDLKKSQSNGK